MQTQAFLLYLFGFFFCDLKLIKLCFFRQTCREQSNEIHASVSSDFSKRTIAKPKIGSKMNVNEVLWP